MTGASAEEADRAATPSEPSQEVSGKAGIPCAERDFSKPPRTEFEGREYEVSLTFRCPTDLTEDQLWEWLQFEWGYGSIASNHPGHDAEINRVEITDLRATRRLYYVDWGPTSKDGKASGQGRVEYAEQVSA